MFDKSNDEEKSVLCQNLDAMHSPLGIESSALHLQDAFDESMNKTFRIPHGQPF